MSSLPAADIQPQKTPTGHRYLMLGFGNRSAMFLEPLADAYKNVHAVVGFCDTSATRMQYAQKTLGERFGFPQVPHFAAADLPLTFDTYSHQPLILNAMATQEWTEQVAEWVRTGDRRRAVVFDGGLARVREIRSELAAVRGYATSLRLADCLPLAATLVAAFLLALGALVLMGPLDSRHLLLGRFLGPPLPSTTQPAAGKVAAVSASDQRTATPSDSVTGQPDASAAGNATGAPPAAPGAPDASPPPAEASPAATGEPMATETDDRADVPPLPPVEPAPAVAADASADTPSGVTALNDPRLNRAKLPADMDESETEAPPEPLATYTSDQHVLAKFDAVTSSWLRVVTHEPLEAGQRLVALPTYRPQIQFSSGVQVAVVGPADLELLETDSAGVPGVKLYAGRLLALSAGKPRLQLRVQLGARESAVSFDDLDSTLALHAWSYLPPGVDPESHEASLITQAFSATGRVTWSEKSAASVALEPGQALMLVNTSPSTLQLLDPPPSWLNTRDEPLIHQTASRALEPLLDPTRPLITVLHDQVGNRQVEVRALAVRSLLLFDEYEPFVTALNSRESRYYWKDLAESARAAMTRSPAAAAKLRAAYERLRGDVASQLYQLLGGLSPEQLADGGDQLLVTCLSSAATDVRVLAYLDLTQITGKTNNYQPDLEPRMQRRSITSWERDLRQGLIRYKAPPIALPGTEGTP